jgi:hypothetical protein
VSFTKVYGTLRSKIDKFFVFGPVILSVGVPVHGKLSNGEQRE